MSLNLKKQKNITIKVLKFLTTIEAIRFYKITDKEFRLLICLSTHGDSDEIFIDLKTLSAQIRYSTKTCYRILNSLIRKNLLIKKPNPGRSNSYFIQIPDKSIYDPDARKTKFSCSNDNEFIKF